jgi:cytochrome P450
MIRCLLPRRILDLSLNVVREKCRVHDESNTSNGSVYKMISAIKQLTPLEMDANLVALTIAATNTLSNTLLCATWLLARHKACAMKAREEIRTAFSSEEDILYPASCKLPYFNAVLSEVFRLYPAIPTALFRTVVGDKVEVDGLVLPKGVCRLLPIVT